MATDPLLSDPLLSLRRAIAAQALPSPTTSADVSNANEHLTDDLAQASHLYFTHPLPHTLPLNTLTRFVSTANNDTQVDLRSIFFAWQKKDVAIPEYIASAQEVNEALKQRHAGDDEQQQQVLNLVFVERLDLITWLEGASDDSEYIKPLEGEAAAAAAADVTAPAAEIDAAATATAPKTAVTTSAAGGVAGARPTKVIDPRLQEIYNGERKLGDRNTVLHGIKPTDFSHIRKTAEMFLGRSRSARGQYPPGSNKTSAGKRGIVVPAPSAGLALPKKPSSASGSSRRPDPIILLSPSASSPIRLSNIKTFLQDGVFVPPDHPTLATHTTSNIHIITRHLHLTNDNTATAASSKPSILAGDSSNPSSASSSTRRPTRFILADSTANFKPDYWQRLVAVFTTGQAWQFKTYKWSNPPELFRHAAGIYVGMAGEHVPTQIKDWGRGVSTFTLARWDEKKGVDGAGRWLDREIVEHIWDVIENNMKAKGWMK